MIAIIDYGAGNLKSVLKAFSYLGFDAKITKDKDEILSADKAVLPGVGAIGDAMDYLLKSGLYETVLEFVKSKKPFLGICLGMQMLFDYSEESGGREGMKILGGTVKHFPDMGLKIPHIGWNSLKFLNKSGIFKDVQGESFVYFVHSYYLDAKDKAIVTATADYGVTIHAAVQKDNVFAVQFHPEKSGDVGLLMLKNFAELKG